MSHYYATLPDGWRNEKVALRCCNLEAGVFDACGVGKDFMRFVRAPGQICEVLERAMLRDAPQGTVLVLRMAPIFNITTRLSPDVLRTKCDFGEVRVFSDQDAVSAHARMSLCVSSP